MSANFDFDVRGGPMVTRALNTCTKSKPWKEGEATPVQHLDATEVGEQRGDMVEMKCPNCGVCWTQELAQ